MIPFPAMRDKAKGGRGRRAENPYDRFTVTLPSEQKTALDALAKAAGISRSEMLSKILDSYNASKTPHTAISYPADSLTPAQKFILDRVKDGAHVVREPRTRRLKLVTADGAAVPGVRGDSIQGLADRKLLEIPE